MGILNPNGECGPSDEVLSFHDCSVTNCCVAVLLHFFFLGWHKSLFHSVDKVGAVLFHSDEEEEDDFPPLLMVPLTMQSAPLPPRLRAVPRMLLKRAQGTHHAPQRVASIASSPWSAPPNNTNNHCRGIGPHCRARRDVASVFQSRLSSIKAASHLHTKGWTTSLACCSAHDIHMTLYERFLLLRSTF